MENYENLLNQAYEKVKKVDSNSERFEVPKIEGYFVGKKTIVSNFFQIASYIRRNPEHLQKYLLKELAASGQKEGDKLVMNIRISSSKVSEKINRYIKEFVICKECGKPDTELVKEDRIRVIHCLACGAKHPVQKI